MTVQNYSENDDKCVEPKNPIAKAIWKDLNGRRGFDIYELDEDIQQDIADRWDALAEEPTA